MSLALLDTHALVWLMEDDPALGRRTGELADDALATDGLLVSAVTFWEVALLYSRGRVALAQPVSAWRRRALESGISEVPLSGSAGILAVEIDNCMACGAGACEEI